MCVWAVSQSRNQGAAGTHIGTAAGREGAAQKNESHEHNNPAGSRAT
jgi:hypothetical protein